MRLRPAVRLLATTIRSPDLKVTPVASAAGVVTIMGIPVQIGNGTWYTGDCFDVMRTLPDGCVDMVLCDLPYGTTACAWDSVLPLEPLWAEYRRLCRPDGAIVLTASQPFTTALAASNLGELKYSLVWQKNRVGGFWDVKFRPMKAHEDILVFSRGGCANGSTLPMLYRPQGLKPGKGSWTAKPVSGNSRTGSDRKADRTASNYPKSVLQFESVSKPWHKTQKPVPLFEYLIRTYTDEGMIVLDNTAGSGTTAIAAENCGRRWICIDDDLDFSARAMTEIRRHVGGNFDDLFGA